ncbi:MAG: glycosyltransferase family 9 protein [Mariprofundales bacterium]|nr:glycosyltransferase family 9 protein [Mariprofundales bacterium]
MRVLIIKLSAFGDIVHALPALDDLLHHPDVEEVHWLLDERFASVAELLPDEVVSHTVALKGRGGFANGCAMATRLRRHHFDYLLDLQGLIKSGLLARAIGGMTYGFDRAHSPEWPNRWLVTPVPFHSDDRHVVQCYRRIAAAPFVCSTGCCERPASAMEYRQPVVRLSAAMVDQAAVVRRAWGLDGEFALSHIGGSYATKRLPALKWRELLCRVGRRQRVVVLWGSGEERDYAQRVAADVDGVFAAPERLSVATLAGLLHGCCGYIGPDSGVTHLAAAVGAPTVTLWGPTSPHRMGAVGDHHYDIVAQSPCAPCFRRSCDQFICMPSLSVERIYHTFLQAVTGHTID